MVKREVGSAQVFDVGVLRGRGSADIGAGRRVNFPPPRLFGSVRWQRVQSAVVGQRAN